MVISGVFVRNTLKSESLGSSINITPVSPICGKISTTSNSCRLRFPVFESVSLYSRVPPLKVFPV
ncbi:hypothetical protein Q5M85_04480 [Paraclostridium bifermentans]|nr:hypothetical protein [Paraclostridium bifermentans]